MESEGKLDSFELVVGLEVHIQLNTKSKAFASELNKFEQEPNVNISPVTLALPGTLPYLNKEHVYKAIKLGLSLGSKITRHTYFDRKNYFYPDLPKGYQTTQDGDPICVGGQVRLSEDKIIRIHHIHMEEDAGKSIHTEFDDVTGLDYNRAGTPLVELVTEPDFRTSDEVYLFINKLRNLVQYIEISDAQMQEGSLRCDVNLSVRPKNSTALGTRTEIKNLNSANMARKAVELEFKRQCSIIESGGTIEQQTLDFDFDSGKITPMRTKEDAHDYRYFPEPDLPVISISEELLSSLESEMGMLPDEALVILTEKYGIPMENATTIVDDYPTAVFSLNLLSQVKDNRVQFANFIVNQYMPWVKENEGAIYPLQLPEISELISIIADDKISNSVAMQKLLPALLENPQSPLELAKSLNLLQTDDQDLTLEWITEVIKNNPGEVEKYNNGKKGLIGFFMGQIMKLSRGKAHPEKTKTLLEEELSKL